MYACVYVCVRGKGRREHQSLKYVLAIFCINAQNRVQKREMSLREREKERERDKEREREKERKRGEREISNHLRPSNISFSLIISLFPHTHTRTLTTSGPWSGNDFCVVKLRSAFKK